MNVLEKAPNVVVVCVTLLVGLTIVAVTLLVALGKDAGQVETVLTSVLSGLGAVAGSGALLYAGAGAKSAHNVEGQLNGGFDERVNKVVKDALLTHDVQVHGIGTTPPNPDGGK